MTKVIAERNPSITGNQRDFAGWSAFNEEKRKIEVVAAVTAEEEQSLIELLVDLIYVKIIWVDGLFPRGTYSINTRFSLRIDDYPYLIGTRGSLNDEQTQLAWVEYLNTLAARIAKGVSNKFERKFELGKIDVTLIPQKISNGDTPDITFKFSTEVQGDRSAMEGWCRFYFRYIGGFIIEELQKKLQNPFRLSGPFSDPAIIIPWTGAPMTDSDMKGILNAVPGAVIVNGQIFKINNAQLTAWGRMVKIMFQVETEAATSPSARSDMAPETISVQPNLPFC